MSEYLSNPWTVAIVTGIILFIIQDQRSRIASQDQMHENIEAEPQLTPHFIAKEFDKKPFHKSKRAKKNHKGRKIDWIVSLQQYVDSGDSQVELQLLSGDDGKSYPWVYTAVNLGDYPELKAIKKDKVFRLTGEVDTIDWVNHGIHVTNAKLYIK